LRFIKSCKQCGALSENELCEICTDTQRDENLICLVENAKDILILEESGGYNGFYFVLNELNEEKLSKLKAMIEKLKSKELIFALTHSVHSDATIFFIEENLKNLELKLSKIAQGIPSGVNLENVDFISLHRAMNFRTKIH
ncbi:recombination protein RecR, partial [Campylobacter upsaliensis]|nr:recombination protein RecR [Campylobacter upsaliensis]